LKTVLTAVAIVASSVAFGQLNKDGIMEDANRTLTYLKGYIESQGNDFVVVIDSDYPYLAKGDQIAFMIEGMDRESAYTYKKGEYLTFATERQAMHLYIEQYEILKKHGLKWVRINEHKHIFTESERQEIARQAKELLK
jgi:hypothetical protein